MTPLHSRGGSDMYAQPFDPWAEVSRGAGDPIPAIPLVSIRADDRDITMPPVSNRETCGEVIARMERNASSAGRAEFYAAVRLRDRADYERRFGRNSNQMGDR